MALDKPCLGWFLLLGVEVKLLMFPVLDSAQFFFSGVGDVLELCFGANVIKIAQQFFLAFFTFSYNKLRWRLKVNNVICTLTR